MSTLDGKTKADLTRDEPVHLSIHQLERRLEVCHFNMVVVNLVLILSTSAPSQLLSQLSQMSISGDLPTPPSSPKLQSKPLPESKKRKADYTSSEKSDDDLRKTNKK